MPALAAVLQARVFLLMTSGRRIPLAVLLAFAVAAAAMAAQQISNDSPWSGRSRRAMQYQGIRELSGRVDVARFISQPNPLDLQGICDDKRTAETAALSTQEQVLASLERGGDTTDLILTLHSLAQLHAFHGRMAQSVSYLERAGTAFASQDGDRPLTAAREFFDSLIGIAELRRGELENCVAHRNAARCIFPVRGDGHHAQTSGSERAAKAFLEALTKAPGDLELRWLLNVAMMTLGRYPGGVPKPYLIEPSRFESRESTTARFEEASREVGLDLVERAGGTVLDDFNGDGRLDVVFSSVNSCDPVRIFLQTPEGRFTERRDPAGLGRQLGGINLAHADYDNDGRLDLYVMRGGWEFFMRDSLLRGNGDGTFVDVTREAGVLEGPHRTHSVAWADYDLDGLLDLLVGHEETPSTLFRNRGDGTFENVTKATGLSHLGFVKGVAWGDYDRDGDPDVFFSNFDAPNRLFRNDGGRFIDVTSDMGVAEPYMSFPTWFFDYDNDGWEDLFVASFVPSVVETARHYLGEPPRADTSRLYRNIEGRRFEDVTVQAGLDRALMSMGANFGDIDNDGWLDMYIGTGAPSFAAIVPNVLFRNRGGSGFADVSTVTGTGHLQKGHGVSFGDVDRDGDQDIVQNVGGFVPADAYAKLYFRNASRPGHWIELRLVGRRTNRSAIGARISVTAQDGANVRHIHRVVSAGGSFGANPLPQHIGLGGARRAERIEIYWPVSRETQVFEAIEADRRLQVTEGVKTFEVLP